MLDVFPAAIARLWRRRPIVFALLLSVVTRCAWAASAALGTRWSFRAPLLSVPPDDSVLFLRLPHPFLELWTRWDSLFYLDLARKGYQGAPDAPRLAFFPLFPWLIRIAARVTHLSLPLAGLLVANLCDCIGWALMAVWLKRRLPKDQALWAMLAFAVFPSRNFGFSLYSEGLFLALSMGAFLAFDKKCYALATLCSALVSAVRPQGILVGLALSAAYCFEARAKPAGGRNKAFLTACLLLFASPVGMLSYGVHLWRLYGNPALALQVQRQKWRGDADTAWAVFAHTGGWQDYLALAVAVPVLLKMIRRKRRPEDLLYMLLSFGVPLSSGRLSSLCRFSGVLPPLFVELGQAVLGKRKKLTFLGLTAAASLVVAFRVGQGAKIL